MSRPQRSVGTLVLLVLLVVLFYPVLFLARRVAPEASLRAAAPWRSQLGPVPRPSKAAALAARHLGPRLAAIERDGLSVALWNPMIGGGRGGWLSSPAEGGAPLPVLAAALARPGWTWTALIALELGACFAGCFWLLSRQRLDPWPAAAGSLAFALSGPVAGHWLDWQGSAAALAPLVVAPAVLETESRPLRAAAWAGGILTALLCGPPAWPFVGLGVAFEVSKPRAASARARGLAILAGAAVAVAVVIPALWLARAAAEPGAPASAAEGPSAPLRLSDLVVRKSSHAAGPPPAAGSDAAPSFLGWPAVILALLGSATARRRNAAVWIGALAAALALLLFAADRAPTTAASNGLGLVLALAVAALAAHGAARLLRDLRGAWVGTVGAIICFAVISALLPTASAYLPLADRDEAAPPASPVPASCFADGSRMVALVDAIPPDVAAALALHDVRGADLGREPGYAATLGLSPDRTLPFTRVLDPDLGRFGVRWIVEPLPLRIVSGSIFSAIELSEVDGTASHAAPRTFEADVPEGACRVGVPEPVKVQSITLRRSGRHAVLREDRTLAGESAAWRWYAVPDEPPPGPAVVTIRLNPAPAPSPLVLAWDRSGLALAREGNGVRLWERRTVRPFAALAEGIADEDAAEGAHGASVTVPSGLVNELCPLAEGARRAKIERVRLSADRVEVAVAAETAAFLVVQVKYRPLLWRATINGRPVATVAADRVWTGVPLLAGRNEVVLAARLPLWALLMSSLGVVALAALLVAGRKQ